MTLLASLTLAPSLSGGRGLVHDQVAYAARPITFLSELRVLLDLTPVTPGQETFIAVAAPHLPRNADVKRCTAQLHVRGASDGPSATTSVAVKKGTENAVPYAITVDAPLRPSNVTVRLAGGEVFWRQGGVLTESHYDLPDFAAALNAYLDQLGGIGDVSLAFVVTSDTPGQVDIRSLAFDANRIQTQTWENPADGARRVDRSFDIGFGDVVDAELSPLPADGSQGRVHALSVDVSGRADPQRSLGTATLDLAHGEFATVATDFAAAQEVRPDLAIACTGAVVALANVAACAVYVALQPDADGQPATAAPLAESRLDISAGNGLASWQTVTWSGPVPLEADHRYWLVLRAIQGEAWLAVSRLDIRPLELLRISRSGAFWRMLQSEVADQARGLVRLLYLPGPENPASPVEFVLRSTSGDVLVRAPSELAAQAQTRRIEMPQGGAAGGVRLEVHASASGVVTVANLIQEYD